MQTFIYKPEGICAKEMKFEIKGDIICKAEIIGGCPGNILGITKIIENKSIDEVLESFQGITCKEKSTSCPDQIAQALIAYQKQKEV